MTVKEAKQKCNLLNKIQTVNGTIYANDLIIKHESVAVHKQVNYITCIKTFTINLRMN